ncbi:MAG TPA: hypothetical protein VF331_21645 [Polyangiales bacterium]
MLQVAVGSIDSCGVRTNGSIWCWGSNRAGSLVGGDPSMGGLVAPTQVGTDTDWVSVATTGDENGSYVQHCAIKRNGQLSCWGWQDAYPPAPLAVAGPWSSVSAHGDQVCGIRQGAIYCWGRRLDVTGPSNMPQQIGVDTDWKSMSSGDFHACALKQSGGLYCWGASRMGQLGQGGAAPTSDMHPFDPIRVGTDSDWSAVESGLLHSCGLKTSGAVYCWGNNDYGALGDATSMMQTGPVRAGAATNWTQLALGNRSTCAINKDKQLWCWGQIASFLRTGSQATLDVQPPLQIGTEHVWKSVAVGITHACALTDAGATFCFGDPNSGGLLGDGTGASHMGPFAVRVSM